MTNIRYLIKCIQSLQDRFKKYTHQHMREVAMGKRVEDATAKDMAFAINIIFGSETTLPSDLPNPEDPPLAYDSDFTFFKNLNPKFTSVTVESFISFLRMMVNLDGDIERDPQAYPSSTSGVNLHKVLLFFLTFHEIFADMIRKKESLSCDWQELLANHFLANFRLTVNEDEGIIL